MHRKSDTSRIRVRRAHKCFGSKAESNATGAACELPRLFAMSSDLF
jgi:hypothetical protein